MQLRVSIESCGARAEEVSNLLANYVDQIEDAAAYVRPPLNFITDMWIAPCVEAEGSSPAFSIFAFVEDRQKLLVVSLVALRIDPNTTGKTSCVFHDAQPILPDELSLMCKEFVRQLADNKGGIRWQHKYDQLIRDMVE